MKRIKTFALFMLLALCVTIPAAVASADEVAATSIVGHNLALEDNIEIVYIVEETAPQGAETGVLFWLSPQEEYVYGEQEYKITTPFGTVVNPNTGNTCQKYAFNYLSAKQMTENVYAVSFIKDGENIMYSSVDKYSILQYAYNKKNSETILDGGTASLGEMLSAMLDYGAITQQYFGYNLDRLANATYYRVTVNGGALSDGLNYGLYKDGETVTVIAGEPELGKQFKQWIDEDENVLSTESEYEFTIENDLSLTAIYEERATEGLAYTLINGGNTYYVSGIGTVTDTEIVIPLRYNDKYVTEIGNSAFYNCSSLTSIIISNRVSRIGDSAFLNCSSLTNVTIPDSVKSIGGRAFKNCTSLTNLSIPDSVTGFGSETFSGCTSLTSITIPNSTKVLGSNTFQGCTALTTINIHDSFRYLESGDFLGCTMITNFNVNSNNEYYKSIDGNLYNKDGTILLKYAVGKTDTKFITPNGVTNIGESAFNGCSNLTSINIPNSVTNIGTTAFANCSNLTNITFGENSLLENIGYQAFFSCSNLTNITIPNSVISIGNQAFYYCFNLTNITIPDSVTNIGTSAFNCCYSLTNIIIPNSVTSIGNFAFNGCSSLTSVTFSENSQLTSIGTSAFSGCSNLTNITIPNSVTNIGFRAFYDCRNLTNITIGNGVTIIDDYVFNGCSNLTNITFNGATEQWNAISKGSYWNYNLPATVVHCSNGDVAI